MQEIQSGIINATPVHFNSPKSVTKNPLRMTDLYNIHVGALKLTLLSLQNVRFSPGGENQIIRPLFSHSLSIPSREVKGVAHTVNSQHISRE